MTSKTIYFIIILLIATITFVLVDKYNSFGHFQTTKLARIDVDAANIRTEPSENSEIAFVARKGDTLNILGGTNWLKIESTLGSGYIFNSLVDVKEHYGPVKSSIKYLPHAGVFFIILLGYLFSQNTEHLDVYIHKRKRKKATDLRLQGINQYNADAFSASIEYLEKANKLIPQDEQTIYHLAECYKKLGNHMLSIEALEKLVEIRPANHEYRFELAVLYYKHFERTDSKFYKDKSYDQIGKACELQPDNKKYKTTRWDILLAQDFNKWDMNNPQPKKKESAKNKSTSSNKHSYESSSKNKSKPTDPPFIDFDNLNMFAGPSSTSQANSAHNKNSKTSATKPKSTINSKPKPLHKIKAYQELTKMIGMGSVAQETKEIAALILFELRKSQSEEQKTTEHFVFFGSPGTGKTTVARLLGEILKEIGYLSSGHVVEVSRGDLVAEYVGHTAVKTKDQINKAIGGVLFIDEAYALNSEGRDFGREAIETLLLEMENKRDQFVVIAAGYKNEMKGFIKSNPGLESRFTNYINFKDFNPDELYQIFQLFLEKEKFKITQDAEQTLIYYIKDIYDARTKDFGNGRDIRKIFEFIKKSFAIRVMNEPEAEYLFNNMDVIHAIEKIQKNKL